MRTSSSATTTRAGGSALGVLGHARQANGAAARRLSPPTSAVDRTGAAAYAARNCSTSARSTRSREHSVAAARAFATARSLLAAAQRHTPASPRSLAKL